MTKGQAAMPGLRGGDTRPLTPASLDNTDLHDDYHTLPRTASLVCQFSAELHGGRCITIAIYR